MGRMAIVHKTTKRPTKLLLAQWLPACPEPLTSEARGDLQHAADVEHNRLDRHDSHPGACPQGQTPNGDRILSAAGRDRAGEGVRPLGHLALLRPAGRSAPPGAARRMNGDRRHADRPNLRAGQATTAGPPTSAERRLYAHWAAG